MSSRNEALLRLAVKELGGDPSGHYAIIIAWKTSEFGPDGGAVFNNGLDGRVVSNLIRGVDRVVDKFIDSVLKDPDCPKGATREEIYKTLLDLSEEEPEGFTSISETN